MHVVARGRTWLARHPSAYWFAVAVLAAAASATLASRISAVDEARRSWGPSGTVWVARTDLDAGTQIGDDHVERRSFPNAAVPPSALTSIPDRAELRQQVAAGEVLVAADVTGQPGPATRAADGAVVVRMRVGEPGGTAIGLPVQVVAEGVVLADRATIVEVDSDTVYVAVDIGDGPSVAAAERSGLASLLYLPNG